MGAGDRRSVGADLGVIRPSGAAAAREPRGDARASPKRGELVVPARSLRWRTGPKPAARTRRPSERPRPRGRKAPPATRSGASRRGPSRSAGPPALCGAVRARRGLFPNLRAPAPPRRSPAPRRADPQGGPRPAPRTGSHTRGGFRARLSLASSLTGAGPPPSPCSHFLTNMGTSGDDRELLPPSVLGYERRIENG